MAYTNTDTNMTTSSALSAGMQTYYNRELLRTFEPNLVHLQFGDCLLYTSPSPRDTR